ncbi:hypothetical protein [Planctomicrobium sp. SH664]|uniref:hypothetical protein n=1 Tax=Planctomicrobium sp. SH664 TaxID=3448125 RepID=UPI003F5AFC4C
MTPRLPRQPKSNQTEQAGATYLALFLMLGLGGAFLLLVMMILPISAQILMALILAVPLCLVFHYFTWGQMLSRSTAGEKPSDTDPDPEQIAPQ